MAGLAQNYRESPEARLERFQARRLSKQVIPGKQDAEEESGELASPATGSGWCQSIGVLEIIGGLLGLVMLFSVFPMFSGSAPEQNLAKAVLGVFFVLNIIAGGLLLRSHIFGIQLSLFLLALQVVHLTLGDTFLVLFSGASLTPMVYLTSQGIGFELLPVIGISRDLGLGLENPRNIIMSVGVNFYALILAVLLIRQIPTGDDQKQFEKFVATQRRHWWER